MATGLGKVTEIFTSKIVKIARGAGNKPIKVPWEEGDTVATVLARVEIKLGEDETATMGNTRIIKPEETKVEPGSLIVIARKLANG